MEKEIVHIGNLAGWPFLYAEGLRQLGVSATSIMDFYGDDTHGLNRQFVAHEYINSTRAHRSMFSRVALFSRMCSSQTAAVHFYSGSLFPLFLDSVLLRCLRKPFFFTFGGGDARITSVARLYNPYFYRAPNDRRDRQNRRKLFILGHLAKGFLSDCELTEHVAPFIERTCILPQPVDTNSLTYSGACHDNIPIRLLHIPNEPLVKGTHEVIQCINELKSEGLPIEFRTNSSMTQKDFFENLKWCDIFVDEFHCGSHGQSAVEAMAFGKVVVTFIRNDLLSKYPADLPIVSSTISTLRDCLRELIKDREKLRAIGARSRTYAEKTHSLPSVGKQLIEFYVSCGIQIPYLHRQSD